MGSNSTAMVNNSASKSLPNSQLTNGGFVYVAFIIFLVSTRSDPQPNSKKRVPAHTELTVSISPPIIAHTESSGIRARPYLKGQQKPLERIDFREILHG